MATDAIEDFWVLAGDLTGGPGGTRDRQVNLQDFNILAGNFGMSGATYSDGDVNYDGLVNLQDFNRLAANFGMVLNAPAVGSGIITVDSLPDGTLRVNWDATTAGNNTNWRIQKSTDGQVFTTYAQVGATTGSFIDDGDGDPNPGGPGLPPGTRFWYRVRAYGGNPETPYTAKRGGTTVLGGGVVITDLTEDVPSQFMDDVLVDGSYVIPASTPAGTLMGVSIAPPEDLGFPYVRPTHYNAQANPDGSVSLTFNRHGPYIVKTTRTQGTQFMAVTSGGDYGQTIPATRRSKMTKISPPNNVDLVLLSDEFPDKFVENAGNILFANNIPYEPVADVDDFIQDVETAWIANFFQPITVALIDHAAPGIISVGGGRSNIPVGEYIAYQHTDPQVQADLNFLMTSVRGKIERLDLFGCEPAFTNPPNTMTPFSDDGAAFLQHIATGIDGIVRGWDRSTASSWNPFFSGSFWVERGATLRTFFP